MPQIIKSADIKKGADINNIRNSIILGDSLEVMKKLPTGSIDLIVTSPPYNLKNSSGN